MGLPKAAKGTTSRVYTYSKCAIFKNTPQKHGSNDRKFIKKILMHSHKK